MPDLYKIRDWDRHFETSESRQYKRLKWVATPNKQARGYKRIVLGVEGPAVFGTWNAIIQLGSRMPLRGVFAREEGPLTIADLAVEILFPLDLVTRSLDLFLSPSIAWMEKTEWDAENANLRENVSNLREDDPVSKRSSGKTQTHKQLTVTVTNTETKHSGGVGVVPVRKRTTPPPPLTANEWAEPDRQQIARRLAEGLSIAHWCVSEIPQAEAAIIREISTVVDALAWETAVRLNHGRWCDAVKASQQGGLSRNITQKRLAYWFSDRLYLQEPRLTLDGQSKPDTSKRLPAAATPAPPSAAEIQRAEQEWVEIERQLKGVS